MDLGNLIELDFDNTVDEKMSNGSIIHQIFYLARNRDSNRRRIMARPGAAATAKAISADCRINLLRYLQFNSYSSPRVRVPAILLT